MSAPLEDTKKQPAPPPLPGAAIRSRRSAAEPDRITRFASSNRFDSLDVPVSFLDRRPVTMSPSTSTTSVQHANFQSSLGSGASLPWRSSTRSNMDTITRKAVPERCISQDWLITPPTGQAYQTSHSAMLTPCRISTSQSLPIRRKPKGKTDSEQRGVNNGFPRTASTDGTGGLLGDKNPDDHLMGQSQRLSELTASVQRLLMEREEERKRMSREQFERQIGSRNSDYADEEVICSTYTRSVAAQRPTLWESSSDKLQPQKISQELVNDFFSSPLTESPEYGDIMTVSSITRQKEELERARAVAVATAISAANDNEATLANTRRTICSDSTTSKRLTIPDETNGHVDHVDETASETDGIEEHGDYDQQLDDLAGRMGLIERSPSAVERSEKKGVPPIADDSYRQAAAIRHSSETDEELEDKKVHRRTRSTGGNSFFNFWRHISPRLSRHSRRSRASTPEVTRREQKEGTRSSSAKKKRHSDLEPQKSTQSTHSEEKEWDSVSSEPYRRPHSMATTSSCPSPDSVFVSTDTADLIQPVVNKQVMASLEKDRVRDPYLSFKTRSQQQQRSQHSNSNPSDSPSAPRPNHLSFTSSTTSTSSVPRSSGGRSLTPMKALFNDTFAFKSTSSSTSTISSGPRYLSVSVAAFGYAYRYHGKKNGTTEQEEKEEKDLKGRLSAPPADGEDSTSTLINGTGMLSEETEKQTAARPNSLSTRTASEEGQSSPSILRRRGKEPDQKQQQQPSARQTICGSCHSSNRQSSGLNCQWRLQRRRRRILSETTPRGGYTPTSPLNRSYDSQAANRSSLIMLAVGHSSPRPKSMSLSAADEPATGVRQSTEEAFPPPARTTNSEPNKAEEENGVEIRDGRYFLRVVDTRERDIRAQIESTEVDLRDHGLAMTDEVSGILRTAVGKATLLVTDKFAQFRGLCHQNLAAAASNGEVNSDTLFTTLSSDLEGFWEMVELQVSDVRRMFTEIDTLRANSWQRTLPDMKDIGDIRPSIPPKKKAPPRRPPSESTKSSANREEARKRLMAAKREALARRKAETNVMNSDVIFV